MADRHIKTWAAFLTVYRDKSKYRRGNISVEVFRDSMEIHGDLEDVEGVTTKELADVEGFTTETARRRMKRFEGEKLVAEITGQDGKFEYMPNKTEPERVFRKLEQM